MKNLVSLLLSAAFVLAPTCQPAAADEVKELHAASLEAETALAPKLEELVQRSNSINIQGRALTPEEQAFSEAVSKLESDFAAWQEALRGVGEKVPNEDRLKDERELNEIAGDLAATADSLLLDRPLLDAAPGNQ